MYYLALFEKATTGGNAPTVSHKTLCGAKIPKICWFQRATFPVAST